MSEQKNFTTTRIFHGHLMKKVKKDQNGHFLAPGTWTNNGWYITVRTLRSNPHMVLFIATMHGHNISSKEKISPFFKFFRICPNPDRHVVLLTFSAISLPGKIVCYLKNPAKHQLITYVDPLEWFYFLLPHSNFALKPYFDA